MCVYVYEWRCILIIVYKIGQSTSHMQGLQQHNQRNKFKNLWYIYIANDWQSFGWRDGKEEGEKEG